MAREHLATYLSDHSAGAAAAIQLMQHIEAEYPGTPVAHAIVDVRSEIEGEVRELHAIMGLLDITASRPRKAAAWLSEWFAQRKLRMDDPTGGSLRLLESLEALSIGIEGKLRLWRSLDTAAVEVPGLRGIDFERLKRQAQGQLDLIEPLRLDAARAALGPESSTARTGGAIASHW